MIRKTLFTIIVWLFGLSTFAQTLTVTKEFTLVPNSSVLAMYKNQFGKWEKPDLDITFPYAVVRIVLEGNEREVTTAIQKIGLYLGTQQAVVDKFTGMDNEILFLIPAGAGHVEMLCGNGCKKQTIIDLHRLQPNRVYSGTIHYVPAEEYNPRIKTQSAQEDASSIIYQYVDLGLSVMWATVNVGATNPEDFGYYVPWGKPSPCIIYNWYKYPYSNGSHTTLTKYNNKTDYGIVDSLAILEEKDDVATAKWGGNWRTPTDEEWTELRTICTWTWTTKNGVKGYLVTGTNNNSIFLPAAGIYFNNNLKHVYNQGFYWSSSLNRQHPDAAWGISFDVTGVDRGYGQRCYGRSVRPVCP